MPIPERVQLSAANQTFNSLERMIAARKSPHQARVEQFMTKVREITGLTPLPSVPTAPHDKMVLAQAKLILEETLEVLEACGVTVDITEAAYDRCGRQLGIKDFELTKDETECNLPHIAKELADLSVVTTGMFVELGVADVPILEEVDANNLAKFGPGGHLDENRKWRKPPNHPTPDISKLLLAQGWVQPESNHERTQSSTDVSVPGGRDGSPRRPEAAPSGSPC